jgi:hypothetical protein
MFNISDVKVEQVFLSLQNMLHSHTNTRNLYLHYVYKIISAT